MGLSRRGADILFRHLPTKGIRVAPNQAVWDHRDGLRRSATRTYPRLLSAEKRLLYGNPRYIQPKELQQELFLSKEFVRTVDLSLGKGDGSKKLLVVFSCDGAELHSTASGVFGFMRVLNQIDFVNRYLCCLGVCASLADNTIALQHTHAGHRVARPVLRGPCVLPGLVACVAEWTL